MCGICGFVGEHRDLDARALERMNTAIIRRGPDEEGAFLAPGIGLAMRRLSIIDLEGGKQPIFNEDGSVCVVFNGEIYNYPELRRELEAKGHRFATRSDTEVLVHLYEEHGPDLVHRLRGMFAFALWDAPRRRAVLARDRLGIKPLYYARAGESIVFGSEIKSLLASGVVATDLDLQAVDAFFTFTYIPAPRSIYAAVRKLDAGCRLVIEDGRVREDRYWDADFSTTDEAASVGEWLERVDTALGDSVRAHLLSDVPLGVFLSGGVDSSLVAARMAEDAGGPVDAFTIAFEDPRSSLIDERPYARAVCARYGLSFNERTVEPHFGAIAGEIVQAFDEPFADDSVVPSYYVSQMAGARVKVVLSGLGGDELFGGYHRYRGFHLSRYYDRVPALLRERLLRPLVEALPDVGWARDRVDHAKRFARAGSLAPAQRYLSYVSSLPGPERLRLYGPVLRAGVDPAASDAHVLARWAECGSSDDMNRMFYTDLKTYLPDDILTLSDRLSMWHSLEVRVPLVDHLLVELCARIPSRLKVSSGDMKMLLKRVAQPRIPRDIITHRKQGFESPTAAWLRGPLQGYAQRLFAAGRRHDAGLFDYDQIDACLKAHVDGRERRHKVLFSLMMFHLWAATALGWPQPE